MTIKDVYNKISLSSEFFKLYMIDNIPYYGIKFDIENDKMRELLNELLDDEGVEISFGSETLKVLEWDYFDYLQLTGKRKELIDEYYKLLKETDNLTIITTEITPLNHYKDELNVYKLCLKYDGIIYQMSEERKSNYIGIQIPKYENYIDNY